MIPSATFLARRQNIGSEVEHYTIEKQRKELQVLIGELKDRDKELNDMVAVHQRQLLSWEEDRQKVLTLEERCSKLEGELHKRTEIIKSLTKKVKVLESNQTECQTVLQKTQLQLQEMAQKATHSSLLSEDLEARNENLSNTLVELSAQVGQLQAREQALTTMIKLKDKDIIEAVNHIADCSGKFKMLEHALRDAKMVENCIVKEKQDYKQKLKTLKIEVNKLKEDLTEKTTENNEQREEIIRLKQEKSCLHDELAFTVEREKRKDELLDIAKSKQERTNSELHNLRQIYVKQQSDLQFLNFNVENSQELIQIYDSKIEESKALTSRFQNEEKQLWESSASLPDEKQWHDVSVYLGLTDCSDAKPPEKLDVDCHDLMEKSEMSCGPRNEGCQSDSDLYESKCCHPSNFIIEAPGHMSDMEWMSIFKPSKVQRIVRHKSVCTCSGSVSATKYNSSASELIAIQHSHCLSSSKSALREDETEAPPDKNNLSKGLLINKEAALSSKKEDFSPTSKLQRLLAESRQMVTDLELSTLLPISCENFDSSTRSNLEVSEESDQKNTFVSH
ncbi:coiled-coil domain-containing protein 62 isoform X6 [Ictidomys tridecemlineatus]|uniref:coiled-coil domain-containing protein 62 isoform X8 n=1 Tax=Ictidomys tridecemlineatus TaxID=43179 RepID=UPI001A9EFF3E|nr:coiled-coil domain-containing protein 62 isoform X8 [Ictidomys tridecemlineatus]